MDSKTLTIITCQTREGNFNFSSLQQNLLKPLNSDLAFCGSANNDVPDSILRESKYIWNFPEPKVWDLACDEISQRDSNWRDLCAPGFSFLDNSWFRDDSIASGFIVMYWREVLRQNLTVDILDKYEWFVITRSDFQWVIPHPSIDLLNKEEIYLLDGEKYGGISDRHMIFHRRHAEQILGIATPIFNDTQELLRYFNENEINNLNCERYLSLMMRSRGLASRLVFLPYLGYCVRHQGTSTRWSQGEFNKKLDLFVKYPTEYRYSRYAKIAIKSNKDWKNILNRKSYFRFLVFCALFQIDRAYHVIQNKRN